MGQFLQFATTRAVMALITALPDDPALASPTLAFAAGIGRFAGALGLEVEAPAATASVEFFQDGRALGRRNRPPWTVSVMLGEVIRRTEIRAVARDADGNYLSGGASYKLHFPPDVPAANFWSVTLYDLQNGFFIPNDRKKYSVGENAGMKLDENGGIEIHVAAEKPQGVPEENWLPINRKDEVMDLLLRIYVPDLEKMKTWKAPKAEKLK